MATPVPQLFADATARPDLFVWYGGCAEGLSDWLRRQGHAFPDDLRFLWEHYGGGEAFESEDIAVPFGGPEYATSVHELTAQHRVAGLPVGLVLFHSGLCLSGFRTSDGTYVTVREGAYRVEAEYRSLDAWYRTSIRAEYADRYGLGPEQPRLGRRTTR